jgi:copper chaperone CopZ
MKHFPILLFVIVFVIGLIWTFPNDSKAQLLEVKQTVYGMDCAPCAHGLENRMSNIDGVISVTVSLNNELLEAKLKPGNNLTLTKIRKSVEESGFQPREADIKVTGKMQEENGQPVLITPSGDRYTLRIDNSEIAARFNEIESGQKVTLRGLTQPDEIAETEYRTLAVNEISNE